MDDVNDKNKMDNVNDNIKTGDVENNIKTRNEEVVEVKHTTQQKTLSKWYFRKSLKKGSKWYSVINIEPRSTTAFFRQLATLIGAGMPLLGALRTISRSDQYGIAVTVNAIADDVEKGESLSSSLARFPKIFSQIYINLIVVAEQGGSLEETLKGLANFTENEDIAQNQIKRALLYPVITLFVAIGVFAFALSYIIPTFISTTLETSENLGLIARVLLNVSNFFNSFWWLLLLGTIAIGYGIYKSNKYPEGKMFWDGFKLKIPVLGTILRKIAIMNITRSFGILIKNGVPIVKAIRLLSMHTENSVYAEVLRKTHDEVEKGSKFFESIAASRMFPPFVVDLITVGESSGQLDNMMIKVADSYQDEVEQITRNLGTLIEPILLLVIGVFTALIVFSVFSTYIQALKQLS